MVIFACFLLFAAFLVHLMWWRINMPVQSSRALLIVFTVVPTVLASIIYLLKFITLTNPEWICLALFYFSCALAYICLYSAVEQHSPTLSILTHISLHHQNKGCNNECILQDVNPLDHIFQRLQIMQQVGWISVSKKSCSLTQRGQKIALIFNAGAAILGIRKGG